MKFQLDASSTDVHELLEEYPCLKDYGFIIEESEEKAKRREKIRDVDGGVLWQTSEYVRTVRTPYVNIDSIEQLLKLTKDVGHCVIVDGRNDEFSIEIYDGYRE